MKSAIMTGLIGGIMGLLISFALNYFVVPMPETAFANALGNGISGLMSGFMGGFIGLLMYLKKASQKEN